MKYVKWILVLIGLPLFAYGLAAEPDTRITLALSITGAVLCVIGLSFILGFLPLNRKRSS